MSIRKSIVEKTSTFYKTATNTGLSVKDVDLAKRTVQVIYNTTNFFDSDFDVIRPGAFTKSINERGPQSNAKAKIKHFLFHDPNKMPGKIEVLEEREIDGRVVEYAEVRLSESTDGIDTLIKYQEGIYDNHSIGFQYVPNKIEMIEEGNDEFEKILSTLSNPEEAAAVGFLYNVTEVKQFEGSTVSFGANNQTPLLGVKSENKEGALLKIFEKLDAMQRVMKSGNLSDEGFMKLEIEINQIKQGLKTHFELIDKPTAKEHLLLEPVTSTEQVKSDKLFFEQIKSKLK
jgi:hypothetical protein